MNFVAHLDRLANKSVYGTEGVPLIRWGQLLRESDVLGDLLLAGLEAGRLTPLYTMTELRGGAVTRANAYFLVEELEYGDIPERFRITHRDFKRVTVVADGLGTLHRIERDYLLPIVKGPDALLTPFKRSVTSHRLFLVTKSRRQLEKEKATGALAYLRRGEKISYNVSEDTLKGGIPAQRSQIKGRKPYWYSISTPAITGPRIVLPEHVDRRYMATRLAGDDSAVVIDKLFVAEPTRAPETDIILASLNSILTWYQIELRGRTQLGEGVLELKKPDWLGILVLAPDSISGSDRRDLLKSFEPLGQAEFSDGLASVADPARIAFDEKVLTLLGAANPESTRLEFERETRELQAQRHERAASVREEKVTRKRVARVKSDVEAYAGRVVELLEPFPDPRDFVPEKVATLPVPIIGKVHGQLRIGVTLFDQGAVYADDEKVADADDSLGAEFIHAVLLHEPDLSAVELPDPDVLVSVIEEWRAETIAWKKRFMLALGAATRGIDDEYIKKRIAERALVVLHAV